jgi:hypothetical protein
LRGYTIIGTLSLVFIAAAVGTKAYFLSRIGLKDSCSIDATFDSMVAYLAGALTTILGFYFGDRRR